MKGSSIPRLYGQRATFLIALWGLAAASVVTLVLTAGDQQAWHGFLIAVPFIAATAWFGWAMALFLAPTILVLFWSLSAVGSAEPASLLNYVEMLVVMGIGAVVGDRMHRVWR